MSSFAAPWTKWSATSWITLSGWSELKQLGHIFLPISKRRGSWKVIVLDWIPSTGSCIPLFKWCVITWPVNSYQPFINKHNLFSLIHQEGDYRSLISQTWYVPCCASVLGELTEMGEGRGPSVRQQHKLPGTLEGKTHSHILTLGAGPLCSFSTKHFPSSGKLRTCWATLPQQEFC